MSLNASTDGVRGNEIGARLVGDVAVVPLPSSGLQLHARSKRKAPCSVRRPRVQVSCRKAAEVAVRSAFCHSGRRIVKLTGTPWLNVYDKPDGLIFCVVSLRRSCPWYPTFTLCAPVT